MPSSTYARADMGSAALACHGPFEAGSYQALLVTYTAGPFGIDDMGGLKICFRITSDMTRPQTNDPTAPGYTTAVASNGARLKLTFDWANIRPWQNSLRIQVLHGYLREGDTIKICLGDRSFGGPGMRMQSNAEQDAPLKVFVDAFAAYEFAEIEHSPTLQIVPGRAESISLILSGRRRPGEAFRLGVVPLDRWHNPTVLTGEDCEFSPSLPVEGLAGRLDLAETVWPLSIEHLKCHERGILTIDLLRNGEIVARSNPMSIDDRKPNIYWADLHGQSGETVGAGTAEEYFRFGRDHAFLDACAHQANDFQVSDEFWAELNALSARFHEPGRYVTLAGYEWSANTALGGDHNVYYATEGLPIYRSSNILTGHGQGSAECRGVNALFEAMRAHDAVLMAHVGGRYADLARGHDPVLVRAVEVHSTWGTFEWLLHDALELGYRPGVVAQSDDHKGRPGLAWPGNGTFGAIGGLTAYCMPELSRPALIEAIRKRRCYATTGARILLDVEAHFDEPLLIFDDDPAVGSTGSRRGKIASAGSVIQTQSCAATLRVNVHGTASLERIDVFDGRQLLATRFMHQVAEDTRRIRIQWQGAEYRGRGRQTVWDGAASLSGNHLVDAQPVNMLNPEKPLRLRLDAGEVTWSSVTTGNLAGVDLWLARPREGFLKIVTPVASAEVSLSGLSQDGLIVQAGGLGRQLRVLPYPEKPASHSVETTVELQLEQAQKHALYVRVTQCDGHQAWSTPIYLI